MSDQLKGLPQFSVRPLRHWKCNCVIFLSLAFRTIWRLRDRVKHFGLQVEVLVETLEHVGHRTGLLE